MSTTQQDRMMSITTPLGEDYLLINKFTANENLSELFKFEVELLHEENEAGDLPTIIDIQDILGQNVTVEVVQRDGTRRLFNGIINQFTQGNRDMEIYDFPAGYARKYDSVSSGGSEDANDLQNVFSDTGKTAKTRMEELDAQYRTFSGISDCSAITAGYRFKLFNHPDKNCNVLYSLTSVTHHIEQSPDYVTEEEVSDAYGNSFVCIEHKTPFRPPQKTPKPIIQGTQTAFVVGLAGEEIFTDKYGRVKVQFHWDREGQIDDNSSCWIRVAQAWAGNRWGMMFIPRIGMKVIVGFMEGDPDQPIIVGGVYNDQAMPPYKLPDEKTKMTIKSDSSKGGQGFNELRFEDKKDHEQIFIHAEKDMDIRVKADCREYIGNDRHLVVKNDRREKIDGDTHLLVAGNQIEKVEGSHHLKVDEEQRIEVAGNHCFRFGSDSDEKFPVKSRVAEGEGQKVTGEVESVLPDAVLPVAAS